MWGYYLTLMALETVNSPKVKAVADKLSTMAMANGAYWYEYQDQMQI